ncbi:transcriptional regulation of mitochondrial recombination-domain-containing protein [Kalaharituber pfeilii]|nr:transcriptional regulation of mitochondrial recombination-domain-containing protein [Kalaharituber pfeilii]
MVAPKRPRTPHPFLGHLGRVLFIYNEIYTNQVIYSLYRSLQNNAAIKQLMFVGKQSVPATLRKDRWSPLACVHFPTPQFGLDTYRLLREFRIMHETQYDPALLKLTKEKRKKKLQDQKANSIADLAQAIQMELEHLEKKNMRTGDEQIVIKWQNPIDGEYAKSWPGEVRHMQGSRPERYTFAKADLPDDMQLLLPQPPEGSLLSNWGTLLDGLD